MEAIMELADLTRTIMRYRWLILALILVGECVAAYKHYNEPTTYTASTRLVLNTPDPESSQQAVAIADTTKALATSPSQVEAALARAGVTGRKSGDFARHNVSVRALGSSGIVQISVTDEDPQVAPTIANALAAEVIATRLDVTSGAGRQVMRDLDRRISTLNRKISAVDSQIRSQGDGADRLRDSLVQERSILEAERVNLLAEEASRAKPTIISRASRPTEADASRLLPDMVLGALVGLLIGIGVAGIQELARPRITGPGALARAFDTPLLGTLGGSHDDADLQASGIAARLGLAAEAAGVTNVSLLAVGELIDLDAVTRRLRTASLSAVELEDETALARTAEGQTVLSTWTAGDSGGKGVHVGAHASQLSLSPFAGASSAVRDGRTGLVVVSSSTLSKQDVDEAIKLVRRTSLSLLGLIAYEAVEPTSEMRPFPKTLGAPGRTTA